jgi:ABC-type enterochelin transport system permease subunit
VGSDFISLISIILLLPFDSLSSYLSILLNPNANVFNKIFRSIIRINIHIEQMHYLFQFDCETMKVQNHKHINKYLLDKLQFVELHQMLNWEPQFC